jgi:hypothetical protein
MSACTQALNKMQVSTIPQIFGKAGAPGVQVVLPMSISDGQYPFLLDSCPLHARLR